MTLVLLPIFLVMHAEQRFHECTHEESLQQGLGTNNCESSQHFSSVDACINICPHAHIASVQAWAVPHGSHESPTGWNRQSPLQPGWARTLQIGDASGIQSPLSFGGFGAMMRHLPRLRGALTEALQVQPLLPLLHTAQSHCNVLCTCPRQPFNPVTGSLRAKTLQS